MTVVLLSCIQVNDVHVFQCLTFSDTEKRENLQIVEMLLDQKAAEEKEKTCIGTDRNIHCIIL